jgi:hypothetical protein
MTQNLSQTRMVERQPRSIREILDATQEEILELPALIRQESNPARKLHLVARLKCRQAIVPTIQTLLKRKEKEARS